MKPVPRPHAELIKLWADGVVIERLFGEEWAVVTNPTFHADCVYRAQPEREFPKSSLDDKTLVNAYLGGVYELKSDHAVMNMRRLADAAVKQYILDTEKKV